MALFISDRRVRGYRTLPRADSAWALDSGGFTQLAQFGTWDNGPTPAEYAARVRRYRDEIGHLAWAAPQDWMCEPHLIAKTGLIRGRTPAAHRRPTTCELRDLAPDLPIIPVVQGWTSADYLHCVDLYTAAGIDLSTAELVGVGSVCRRQSTTDVGPILADLHRVGVSRLHGFGFKILGLARHGHLLTSADSMAWSAQARRQPALPGCTSHINCANCPRYALQWRRRVLAVASRPLRQPALFDLAGDRWPA